MRSHNLTPGRMIGVVFDHGDDFFTALAEACHAHDIKQGYIPMFIAGLSTAKIVGTCQRLDNPNAPVWTHVDFVNVEALGGGTIAWDDTNQKILPHIHLTAGLKEYRATAHTSHLLDATVQFLTEMLIIEIRSPVMRRLPKTDLYDVPQLHLG
ncbi:PPC domain-containing DNA-binding protein [Micromonospora aurantiaca (nom. illeg.)]|uniref:PPC domain-containing DNA-binding protein n=1 Tax=Micromonospora aurantiaca (nom. illeg.) TaxID=47850 RepID=UPI00340D1FC3